MPTSSSRRPTTRRSTATLARGALTRIALVEDGFANVSKIASGFPYNDFRGDPRAGPRRHLHLGAAAVSPADKVSFFATSKCRLCLPVRLPPRRRRRGPAVHHQSCARPQVRGRRLGNQESAAPDEAAIRLIEAMASDGGPSRLLARAPNCRGRASTGAHRGPAGRAVRRGGADRPGLPASATWARTPIDARRANARPPQARSPSLTVRDSLHSRARVRSAFLVFSTGGLE